MSTESSSGAREQPTRVVYAGSGASPTLMFRSASLHVVAGPDAGLRCSLELRRVRVGTAGDNDLVLKDDQVSRHHLEFQLQDRGFMVQDLGSTNGTYYRGARIKEALLDAGAEIRLGASVIRVEPQAERSEVVHRQATFGQLVGASPAMQEVYGLLAAVAPTDVTVLLEGETGTGKELVADELHRRSPRGSARGGPFQVVDCASIPANLIESELFGHARGAFTGATGDRAGAFERASGGSIFLDEVGELPLELQSRLLRVLEQRVVRRVGGSVERRADVRVIAATNRELRREVAEGRFRQDLFYRLAVVCIVLPPLRRRSGDIPLLARHFLWEGGCPDPDQVLTPEVLETLGTRRWPGNVRELRNAVERALLFVDGGGRAFASAQRRPEAQAEAPADLEPPAGAPPAPPPSSDRAPAREGPPAPSADAPWEGHWLERAMPPGFFARPYKVAKELLVNDFELLYLRRLLQRHGRNISRIAAAAGIDRRMVRKLMHKHGYDR